MQYDRHIIYLHGFNSSPQSAKAQQFLQAAEADYPTIKVHCPHLHHQPLQAMARVIKLVQQLPDGSDNNIGFVGSSLGGFYATWLADYCSSRAVLINPAVRPDKLLQDYLGSQRNYHDDQLSYELTQQHLQELEQLQIQPVKTPENLWVLLQIADEILDYRQAVTWYQGCPIDVQEGGSHAYDNFIEMIPQIMTFLR